MKHLWIIVVLYAASAFGQNAYGPDYLNFHCTTPDPNSNTVFGIPPKSGLVPNTSASGNLVLYCDAASGTLKSSFSGSAYNAVNPGLLVPFNPEGFLSWNPGAVAANSCTTNTFSLPGARINSDYLAAEWPSNLPANLVGMMRVSTSDTIEVRLCNPTASPTTNAGVAMSFAAKVVR